MADFERLGLSPELIEILELQGWFIPTSVQDEAIPLILGGRDVCVAAETGSGKTGSFVIPCVQLVHESLRQTATCDVSRNFKDVKIIHEKNYLIATSSVERWSGFKLTDVSVQNRGMYEVTILSDGLVRVGWTTSRGSFELGKDDQSFGYGGLGKKSFNKVFQDYGAPFGKGDVIGCMIDRTNQIIVFSKNGVQYGVAFEIPPFLHSVELIPGICGKCFNVTLQVSAPFKYPIAHFSGLAKRTSLAENPMNFININQKRSTLCLILEPTRDLARQTYDVLQHHLLAFNNPKLTSALLIGGQDDYSIMSELKKTGADIVVGSLGKVFHAMRTSAIDLSKLQYLVLDEADELISQDTTNSLLQIKQTSNESNVQTLFFSATLDVAEVREAIDTLTKNAAWINLKGPLGIPETVHFVAYTLCPRLESVPCKNKLVLPHIKPPTDGVHDALALGANSPQEEAMSQEIKLLKPQIAIALAEALCMDSCMIFCRTNLDCENFEAYLNRLASARGCYSSNLETGPQNPYSCVVLAGVKSQKERDENLKSFKKGMVRFLICTDVAARGLDIDSLPYVIMLSIPDNPSIILHRIGRVGRYDKMGLAIAIVSQVKEKVWYHSCPSRGKNCRNTRLKEEKGCCIWYDEKKYLADFESRLGQSVLLMNPETFSVKGVLEFHDKQVLSVVESEQEEWMSAHDSCVDNDARTVLQESCAAVSRKPIATIYGKSKIVDSEKCAQAAALEIENSIKELQLLEKQAQEVYLTCFYLDAK